MIKIYLHIYSSKINYRKFSANKVDSICLIFSVFIKPPGRSYCPLKRTIAPLSKFARTSSLKELEVPIRLPTKAWIQTTYCLTYSKSIPNTIVFSKSKPKKETLYMEESMAAKPVAAGQ